MPTQIHGFGPNGELSPGAAAALAGLGGGGGGATTITADDTPAAPAEGESASYFVTSAVVWPAGLVWSTDPDGGVAPTITTTALVSMFTVGGTTYAVMGSTYPAVEPSPDETDPTAGTLGVVVTSTTADGTVTGATDETELHATPYSFRIDAGTWSAWQAGATYEWTGLTASTEYDFQHRVRDAAGNITEGTVVTDSTDAPSSDTTDPTPGTLASSSITDTSFTLTVTGASDETALHSQPYAFSTDNGSTWTAWQTSPSRNMTGLTAETAYQARHKVRDAALNEATGTAIEVTTSAASIYDATETFEYDPGTSMVGKTSTTGGLTWASDISNTGVFILGSIQDPTVGAGQQIVTSGSSGKAIVATLPQASARISADYDTTATGGTFRLAVASTDSSNTLLLRISASGGVRVFRNGATQIYTDDAAGVATTGRASLSYDATTGAVEVVINSVTEWSGTTDTGLTGTLAGAAAQGASGLSYDNVGIEYL